MKARTLFALGGALAMLWAVPVVGCAAGDDGSTTVERAQAQVMLEYENFAIETPVLTIQVSPKTAAKEIQEKNFEKGVYVEWLLEWKMPPGPCPPELSTRVVLDLEGPGLIDKGGLPMVVELRDLAHVVVTPTVAFDCTGGPCLAALIAKVLWADEPAEHPVNIEVEVR